MVYTEGRLPICRTVGDCVGMHPQKLVTGVQLLLRRRLSKVVTVRLRGAADSTAYTSPKLSFHTGPRLSGRQSRAQSEAQSGTQSMLSA